MPSRPANYLYRVGNNSQSRLDEIIALQRGMVRNHVHLVASASYPFPSVLRAMAEPSLMLPTEGLPGSRYLPGAEVMDIVETEGEHLALQLFGRTSGYRASLQPHSCTQANQIVFNTILSEEDCVLSLKAKDGGHISHSVLLSNRNRVHHFGLTEDGRIDYDQMEQLAIQHQPKLIIVGGSALPRETDFERCGQIARQCGARLHGDLSHVATFIAGKLHKDAFPHVDFASFNTMKNLRGPNAGVLIYREDVHDKVARATFPTTQGGANEANMLAKFAALLEWSTHDISAYAQSITRVSQTLAATLQSEGIELISGGTDSHLILLDLSKFEEPGSYYERCFEDLGVLLNKNLIPGDQRPPSKTSGLRIGATNLAILGYDDTDIKRLGGWLASLIRSGKNDQSLIQELVQKYLPADDLSDLVAPMRR
ncbi:aminotransferase class V-fold PLP-dependent enzyme [uncultured Roseobacter sp.]|uniref:serine hydroxymethyltransferase n=1 Tax=uncultured Roseobacter sp. TaxID=114847 RepID=UPI002628EFF3|nr:aminotransferase class V-fold PLP-dependent enzyme [uncultured Roseobacter sp.]